MKFAGLILLSFAASIFAAGPLNYAPAPNDAFWTDLWHLDNRDTNGVRTGIDVNARAAWPISRGAGVNIAIVDDGVDLNHPDLAAQALPGAHWNFETDTPNGNHPIDQFFHGTAVAGMAIAQGNNRRGIIGVAPESRFASWVIFRTNPPSLAPYVSATQRAKMFQYLNDAVAVQNHSWVTPGNGLIAISPEENAAISNAVTLGRGGKGVVLVRAAGNARLTPYVRNVNEDRYLSDPRVITVAAVRADGRAASYSTPGAAILVSAPSGDFGSISPVSTDRVGNKGFNVINFQDDHADYVYAGLWQGGTSSAAPLISGIVALMLSANPNLTYRDVQQILALSARQTDLRDGGVAENGAGLLFSHNAGFGVVDAGTAVDLARDWTPRPAAVTRSWSVENPQAITDAGVRVRLSGSDTLPPGAALIALPSLGILPDSPTAELPLVYVGFGFNITNDLHGKGALIQRGGGDFAVKIENAREAGAEFAILYNDRGTNELQIMGNTDFVGIPAVFISRSDGDKLADLVTNETITAQLAIRSATLPIEVDDTLICEHVTLELEYEHELRGDVRVTLLSPMGTRSVLQRLSDTTTPFSGKWTYTSVQHLFESSKGTWTVEVSDQASGATGTVTRATLVIDGVPIVDSDADGLDDTWETQRFGSLEHGPKDDPDLDGYSNAREQILGSDPAHNGIPLEVILSSLGNSVVRINWPSRAGAQYEVIASSDVTKPFLVIATVTGDFPRTEWIGKVDRNLRFFRVREKQ